MKPPAQARTDCAYSIFQQPWWLEAAAPRRWSEATLERDGRVVARLPYVVRGRGRLRVLTQPEINQTLGPWIEPGEGKQANVLGREMELLTALEERLPDAHAFKQNFSPALLNALPFHWAGYSLRTRYTYRLEGLASEEALWSGLRDNIRREIRKARKRVEVRDDLGVDRFYAVLRKTFARQGLEPRTSFDELARVDAACAERDSRVMLFAEDESGRVHAATYIVWDEQCAYYLYGGGDPELRTSGASSLLLWEAIMRAREVTDVFDFEGSMLKPVERFFRAFGSTQTPYLAVARSTRAARAGFALSAGVARAGCRLRRSRSA